MLNKKGDFGWENIAKILLVILILVMLLLLIKYLTGVGKDKIGLLSSII